MPFVPEDIYRKLTNLDCEEVAMHLGLEVKAHKCSCFMHDDRNPSLSFFQEGRKAWNCFVCNKGGTAVQLVEQFYSLDSYEAAKWLCREFGIEWKGIQISKYHYSPQLTPKAPSPKEHAEPEKKFDRELCQSFLEMCPLTAEAKSFLFEERKLKASVIEEMGIAALSNQNEIINKLLVKYPLPRLVEAGILRQNKFGVFLCLWTPCLLIPYRDVEGNLVAVQSRYLGSNLKAPRFQFLFNSRTRLYNMQAIKGLEKESDVFIAEGITDCLALLSTGKIAVAFPSATILPKQDLGLLRGLNAIIVADNDEAGQKAVETIRAALEPFSSDIKEWKVPEKFKDFSQFYLSEGLDKGKADLSGNVTALAGISRRALISKLLNSISGRLKELESGSDEIKSSEREYLTRFQWLFTFLKGGRQETSDTLLQLYGAYLASFRQSKYNLTYYSLKREYFNEFLCCFERHLDFIAHSISEITEDVWKELAAGKMKLVFDHSISVATNIYGGYEITIAPHNQKSIFNISPKKVSLTIDRLGYVSPETEVGIDYFAVVSPTEARSRIEAFNNLVKELIAFSHMGRHYCVNTQE